MYSVCMKTLSNNPTESQIREFLQDLRHTYLPDESSDFLAWLDIEHIMTLIELLIADDDNSYDVIIQWLLRNQYNIHNNIKQIVYWINSQWIHYQEDLDNKKSIDVNLFLDNALKEI